MRALDRRHAPDALVEALERLPRKDRYHSVQELAQALTRVRETERA